MNTDKITFANKNLDFKEFTKYSKLFIETGTCYGRSTKRALEAGFEKVKTVECYEPFHNACSSLFFNEKLNVELYLGKSFERLPDMLKDVTSPAVFFLDAHPTGENSGGHDDLMEKGEDSEFHQNYIIIKELQVIMENGNKHIIIIDDQNRFNEENLIYMQMLLDVNSEYRFEFWDEQDGKIFYKHKSLVCIPNG